MIKVSLGLMIGASWAADPAFLGLNTDTDGFGVVDVGLPSTQATSPHRIHLGVYGQSYAGRNEMFVSSLFFLFPTTNAVHPIGIPVQHQRVSMDPNSVNLLGVGPGSDLQRQYGSVDIVRNGQGSGFMTLGMPERIFVGQLCQADSVIRIPTRTDDNSPLPNVRTQLRFHVRGTNVTHDVEAVIGYSPSLMTVPYSVGEPLVRALQLHDEEPYAFIRFGDCAAARARLPMISLHFSSGELRLTPEDYTKNLGEDICEMLIARASADQRISTIRINPLFLTDMNFRSTDDGILVCDSTIF